MGDHKQVFTHKDRIFVNKNENAYQINNQLLATRDTWLKWFMVNRSVNTSVNHRSYAEVLQSSCNNDSAKTLKKYYKPTPCQVNPSTVSHAVYSNDVTPDVTHFTTSRGNKNKTGNKLGQVTQELPHLDSTDQFMHRIPCSRGNKNGTRAKLGEVHHKSANSDQAGTGNRSQRALTQTVVIQAPNISDISTGHDLACLEEEHNDNYVYLYDVSGSPVRHKRNIPEYIYSNKFSSQDYVKCVQQNGKDFGFLPLNNLMLYTGDDIIWTNVPSVIEAHAIVKKSGKPNFMGARIPLPSQFNIKAWKFYLAQYWEQQIVDLLQYGFPLDFDRSALLQNVMFPPF